MSKDNREECPDCKGTGVDYCNDTHPKGWTVCLKCKRCKTCNGTGEVTIDSGADVCEYEYNDIYEVFNSKCGLIEDYEGDIEDWKCCPCGKKITIKGE